MLTLREPTAGVEDAARGTSSWGRAASGKSGRRVAQNLTEQPAAAVMTRTTSREVVGRFTVEHGWSDDEIEAWPVHATSTLRFWSGPALGWPVAGG